MFFCHTARSGLSKQKSTIVQMMKCEHGSERNINMARDFFNDEKGDTNIISIIVIIGVSIAIVLLFRPYIEQLIALVMK